MPLYYARNAKGYSEGWIQTVKNSIAQIAPHYTMKRQLDDYFTKFYCPLAERRKELFADNYKKAKDIAAWKELVASRWDNISVVSFEKEEDMIKGDVLSGKKYHVSMSSTNRDWTMPSASNSSPSTVMKTDATTSVRSSPSR